MPDPWEHAVPKKPQGVIPHKSDCERLGMRQVCRHFRFLILMHTTINACARFVIKKIQDGGRRRPGDGARKLSGKLTIFVYSLPFPSANRFFY